MPYHVTPTDEQLALTAEHATNDEVVAVWYPSRAAFLRLADYPGYMESHLHRDAAIEQAALIATRGEPTPLLTHPFAQPVAR